MRSANLQFVLFCSALCRVLRGFEGNGSVTAFLPCVLWIIGMLLTGSGCGTTHAVIVFTAPSTATAGTPFTVTVNVLYQRKPDKVINSRIHFTSSDPAAILPPDYYFTPADAGSHTWNNGFTLETSGAQTISGSIVDAIGVNGSATVAVSR